MVNSILDKYSILKSFAILLIIASVLIFMWGFLTYPFEGSKKTAISNPVTYTSIIQTNQSGSTEFTIPLPIQVWNVSVTVLSALKNLTNQGIMQNAPIELNITLTLQNGEDMQILYNKYIFIAGFMIEPIDAIEAIYNPNLHRLSVGNPAEFSSFTCFSTNYNTSETENTEFESFTDTQDAILQDAGLLTLKIHPFITMVNINDPVWKGFKYLPNYYNFSSTTVTPVSITSELDASRDLMQATQQNSQNQFNNIQAQMTEDQKTETIRATSITLFLLAFASFDIGITLIPFSKRKKPETDGNHRKDAESQRKILEYLE